MPTRSETAAQTRNALLKAASGLLDEGGPDAVTLRAVGAGAGVSRGALYGHFADKEELLNELAIQAWDAISGQLDHLRAERSVPARARLEQAAMILITLARRRPHLYALMFSTPAEDAATAESATRVDASFIAIVTDLVGQDAALSMGALLLATAHGIAGLENSGHLAEKKWHVDADELVRILVDALASRQDQVSG